MEEYSSGEPVNDLISFRFNSCKLFGSTTMLLTNSGGVARTVKEELEKQVEAQEWMKFMVLVPSPVTWLMEMAKQIPWLGNMFT